MVKTVLTFTVLYDKIIIKVIYVSQDNGCSRAKRTNAAVYKIIKLRRVNIYDYKHSGRQN
jgi:hypothetical protein